LLAGLLAGGHQPEPGAELHRAREALEAGDVEDDVTAESVSIPRNARSRRTIGQNSGSVATHESRSSSASRRAVSPSHAARLSMNASSVVRRHFGSAWAGRVVTPGIGMAEAAVGA
jgi:hypothetical protein